MRCLLGKGTVIKDIQDNHINQRLFQGWQHLCATDPLVLEMSAGGDDQPQIVFCIEQIKLLE